MADAPQTQETPGKTCAVCKKRLSRARRYYRNGQYYCNKNCFKKGLEKT